MAKTIETKTETITDPPVKMGMNVNERIQVARFWIRAVIACLNLGVLAGIIFYLLLLETDVPETVERVLLIIVGPLILTMSSVGKYFFESGNDLEDHATNGNGAPPPQPQIKEAE